MAHIFYTPENGFSWPPTLLGREAINAVHDERGHAGVYYVLAFGLDISPHAFEMDLAKRDEMVIDELKAREYITTKGAGKFSAMYYQNEVCQKAIQQANQMICNPNIRHKQWLEKRIASYMSQMSPEIWNTDPEKQLKSLNNDKVALELITKLRNDLRLEETHLNKMVSHSGMLSLDEFMN